MSTRPKLTILGIEYDAVRLVMQSSGLPTVKLDPNDLIENEDGIYIDADITTPVVLNKHGQCWLLASHKTLDELKQENITEYKLENKYSMKSAVYGALHESVEPPPNRSGSYQATRYDQRGHNGARRSANPRYTNR